MSIQRVVVYTFPNGFRTQAEHMYGWLRYANLNPAWGTTVGDMTITLPENEVPCLREMQKANPARWGNCPKSDE